MTENFLNLERRKATEVHEAQRVQMKMKPMRPTAQHIRIKVPCVKNKERILKSGREKHSNNKGAPMRLAADFST